MDAIIYDKIDEVQGKVEYNGGGINALQQDTAALLAKGVVKSVQRGVVRNINFSGTYSIPISTVNLDKSILITEYTDDNININFTLTSSSISIGYTGMNNVSISNVSWQVIEFY